MEKRGRKKGIVRNKLFFGYKYTADEYEELKKVFEDYKKRNNLTSTQAIKKIILEKSTFNKKVYLKWKKIKIFILKVLTFLKYF